MHNEKVIIIKPAFEDERGSILNILEEPITHVAIITSKNGSIRANHYHPTQIQYEYLISGRYESVTKNLKGDNCEIEKRIIEPGSLVITYPMVAHAMIFLEDSVMLNMTTDHRDARNFSEHTKPYKLV